MVIIKFKFKVIKLLFFIIALIQVLIIPFFGMFLIVKDSFYQYFHSFYFKKIFKTLFLFAKVYFLT